MDIRENPCIVPGCERDADLHRAFCPECWRLAPWDCKAELRAAKTPTAKAKAMRRTRDEIAGRRKVLEREA